MLRKSSLPFSVVLCCGFSVAFWPQRLSADEPSYRPAPFACEIRYHFREHFRAAKLGQKTVSAPAFEREPLPMSRIAISNGMTERIVEGRVPHLPYHFSVKIWRRGDTNDETLQVNVVDSSGKPVAGFPQLLPNPLTTTGESSRKQFELPVGRRLKRRINKTLLTSRQFLTHVDLIVGMDEDFLSAPFPK